MTKADLISQIEDLEEQSSVLEPSEGERAALTRHVTGFAASFINRLSSTNAFQSKILQSVAITGNPSPLTDILELYNSEVVGTGINAASGGHLGYIPGGGIYAGALADYLAAVTNPFAGAYFAAPGAAAIENEVVHWLKELFSFPETATGCLSSGGSISTLIALTAARDKHGIKGTHVYSAVVYLSSHVHHSVQKALRIIGLEDVVLRSIPTDTRHRMDAQVLADQVIADEQSGLHPFLVVGTAGTTDTGAVDPLEALADITEKHGLWFHVDAAYGGFFILTDKKHLFMGIERADSLIVDPHKGLFLPYGVGAVLVKDRHAVLQSHFYTANYMQDAADEELALSPANLSPELTRHFRGLRVWLPLQLYGTEPFATCLAEKLLLVNYFRLGVQELGFEVGPDPDLSVSYFYYPFSGDSNHLNRLLLEQLHADGEVFFSSSQVDSRFVIRIAILSFRTKRSTVDAALAMVERCLQRVRSNT